MKKECQNNCPTRWCCSMENFVPPPLSRDQVGEIAKLTGRSDFFDTNGGFHTLRAKENGYCVFFDEKKSACEIYLSRPFDCLLYPFDFVGISKSEGIWLVWECAYSDKLDDARIEENLVWLEQHHATDMFRMWDYANDTVDLNNPDGFRVLRKTNVAPHRRVCAEAKYRPAGQREFCPDHPNRRHDRCGNSDGFCGE